jgi:hypothetical protein
MSDKETGIEGGFFTRLLGAARGPIFRQGSSVEVVAWESFDDGESDVQKSEF